MQPGELGGRGARLRWRGVGMVISPCLLWACAQAPGGDSETNGLAARRVDEAGPESRVLSMAAGAPSRLHPWRSSPSKGVTDTTASARAVSASVFDARRVPSGARPQLELTGTAGRRGRRVVSFEPSVEGIPVWQRRTTVLLNAEGKPHAISTLADTGSVVGDFVLDAKAAAELAWSAHRPESTQGVVAAGVSAGGQELFQLATGATGSTTPSARAGLLGPIQVSRTYFPTAVGLIPAFSVTVGSDTPNRDRRGQEILIGARDGAVLAARTTLAHAHTYRVWTAHADGTPAESPLGSIMPYPANEPAGFSPAPAESTLIEVEGLNTNPEGTADPWLPAAATTTQGNNVDAYVDFLDPNGLGAGEFRAETTAAGVFDHAFDLSQGPLASSTQSEAAIVQAFYSANWLHDWYYDSGFDEVAKNAQADNYGRGGFDGDVLVLEVQDAANSAEPARNNANMYTPPDGSSPIMQIYVWSGAGSTSVTATPGGLLPSQEAAFGPATFDVSGPLTAIDDGTADTMDACQTITQNLTGQIALVRRGGCPFVQKADAATAAGAIGILIADNAAGPPPLMDGDSGTANPTLSTTQAAGDDLVAALEGGSVTVQLARSPAVERDGALDGTIVAHEWGHYLQDRLAPCAPTEIVNYTPMASQCYSMGEGGGDFIALHMLLGEDDDPAAAYPMAAYASAAQTPDLYFGLRRYPYSTSTDIDPLTFRHIVDGEALPTDVLGLASPAPNSEVHNAGEIWTTMLFEVYAALLAAADAPDDPRTFADVRRSMSDDLVLALSMMPFERTVLDARDALLSTIAARSPTDAVAAAAAFAKRGAGTCAVAPPFDSTDNTGLVEDFEVSPNLVVSAVSAVDEGCDNGEDGVLDAGETGAVAVQIENLGYAPALGTTVTLSDVPEELEFLEGLEVTLEEVPALGTVTAQFPATLSDPEGIVDASITVSVESSATCDPIPTSTHRIGANYDVDPAGTVADDFSTDTGWARLGPKAETIWTKSGVGAAALWHGEDYATASNTALVSPPIEVSDTEAFQMTFSHRFTFEDTGGEYWDGGVIEISLDDGATWVDAADISGADPGYTGTITAMSDNPLTAANLAPRPAYVGPSADYPDFESQVIDFGTELAGETVRIAFRIGSDQLVGAPGWAIDEVSFSGVATGPFPARALDETPAAACPDPPATGGTDGSGAGNGDGAGGGPHAGGANAAATGGAPTAGSGGGAPVEPPGGCGCRVPSSPPSGAGAWATGLALLALRWRRRRAVSRG